MKKQVATTFLDRAPLATDNIAAGFALGQKWFYNGVIYLHASDGVWSPYLLLLPNGGIAIVAAPGEIGISATSDYLPIEGIGLGPDSFGGAFTSDHCPVQLANSSFAPTGVRKVAVLRGNSAWLIVENEFGLEMEFRLPCLGWTDSHLSEIPGASIRAILTDVTEGAECARFEFWSQRSGGLTKQATLDDKGHFTTASTEIPRGNFRYDAQTELVDTIGDWRTYSDAAGYYTQYCTVAGATKGAGTWVTKNTIVI